MYTFIGIESLAANALIELMDKSGKREVSFDTLVRYGLQIVRLLQQQSGEEAVLLLSKKYQIDMVENYSEFFEVDFGGAGQGIFKLKDAVNPDDLKSYFRWTMSVKLVDAFMAPDAIRELGVAV
ncbi:hypothetical protein CE91St41_36220 [Oscillospiraceae bacterium]|nr:hypothetical protein CE91St40_36200 [Oscillospiraceae bacterium]BDF76733.1 hypothetical protein CE91St41_36220 [Oscillospiraceae bacterium]